MFQIAYGAGHYLYTSGRRVSPQFDPYETREWVLNDRVARFFARAAEEYEDVSLLRVDDPAGKKPIEIDMRCIAANNWGADFCLAIHHNAGAKLTKAGGIEAFSYPGSAMGQKYRDAIYESCIAAGGLRGNRAEPKRENELYVLGATVAPAVLMEYGFMDSAADAPEILKEEYARTVAYATMEGIARVAGLKKKQMPQPPEQTYTQEDFIRQVQAAIGAAVDGIAGPETLSKTVTLSRYKNATHPAVAAVQRYLASIGYPQVGEADGIAGELFDTAVKQFQRDNDCWVDGELTARNLSWRKLLGL